MNHALARTLCRLLIVLMAWTPYQLAQAGMIGTDQVMSSTSKAERSALLAFVGRTEVARELQSFGLDAAAAKDRVAAMTDEEVRYLAGRIDALPAGAGGGPSGFLLFGIVVFIIYWFVWRR